MSNVSSALFFAHPLYTIWTYRRNLAKGKFQNGRICNRSFRRILVAEFQIRTSYSRTCTEDRRQVGDKEMTDQNDAGYSKIR